MAKKAVKQPSNVIVISDLHCGDRTGLCPPETKLDGGSIYKASEFQWYMWNCWQEFWKKWVPDVTKGEPFDLVVNGDVIDGVHHSSTTQISHNLGDQAKIARSVLAPVVKRAANYYHIRGTEAHVGPSAVEEESIARELGATPDETGAHSRWEMWHTMTGPDTKPRRVHFTHHIGGGNSTASEVVAINRAMSDMYSETGRWGRSNADVIVRAHRHRYVQAQLAGARGLCIGVISPGWQGRTPFGYRINASAPQFGGLLVRVGEEGLYVRSKVWSPK